MAVALLGALRADGFAPGKNLFIPPHPSLRPYIAHYTVVFSEGVPVDTVPDNLTLVPDASGCMVFHLRRNRLDGMFWGPTTETVVVHNDYDEVILRLFVEFQPGGANALLGYYQKEYTDLRVNIPDMDRDLFDQVELALYTAVNLRVLATALDSLFLQRLATGNYGAAGAMAAIRVFSGGAFQGGVSSLAQQVGYSQRQVSRIFGSAVGMTPKQFIRLTRINLAMQEMQRAPAPLSVVAAGAGYFDEAHFIHDFKRVCGVTPAVYRRRMAEFYNEPAKF